MERFVVDVGDWDPRDIDIRHAHFPQDDWPSPSELAEEERARELREDVPLDDEWMVP